MGLPAKLIVEVGFSAAPLDAIAGISWTDISAYVRMAPGFSTSRGRSDERGQVEAGVCTLTLTNRSRRFEPLYAAGPYYPNIKPMVRLRLRATHNAVTYDLFHGYIESWTPSYPDEGRDAYVTVTAVDAFAVLALLDLDVPYVMEVLKDSPTGYWRLNETGGTVAADSSGNGYDGEYIGAPTFSQSDPITDDVDGAILLTVGQRVALPTVVSLPFSLEIWFKHGTTFGATTNDALFSTSNIGLVLSSVTKKLIALLNSATVASSASYDDNAWHHAVMTIDSSVLTLYVDGVSQGTASTTGITFDGTLLKVGGSPSGGSWEGFAAAAVLYPTVLSSTRVSAHYAQRTAWLNQLSGTRMNALLDIINWPTADRDVDAGQSTLQSAGDIAGTETLTHLLDVGDWENGLFLVEADGKIRFDSRHARLLSPANTSQVTFADTAAGTEKSFSTADSTYDVDDVRNVIEVTVSGGAKHTVKSQASIDANGRRTLAKSTKIVSESEAQDAADWLLTHLKDPQVRINSMTVRPAKNDARWVQCLTRRIGDRITLTQRPIGGGAQTSKDFHIEHIDHNGGGAQVDWTTTWLLSPADDDSYWILDDATYSVLDTTTKVAY